ncbi:hypothetical protein BDA96_02G033600 [Sorghum bicolor]|uniref:Cell differentiation protein rcd1 n=3 Tax=Sorghum bicolor TaxID=4558 RepID=A0A921UR97_SORBI|nr:CCR4-NOT transcription complex subunit 9 isoform X2 [Sorghum bicolor]EER97974.1 hypothetical protein SORBI_3002G033500 [Sorghum bicolor]KAG0541632.1 hypothetical protein BDA96_02G033600 [Sorghum bicolor]|eukprot:XP_002461453.1 CCR4-NOT transcription complex subunit 9 isoform X2 [Sorghum bicolor]
MFNNLAPLMWHSFGSIIILIQEILSVYPALSPPTLTACASSRVCNAVALLQSVASHPETRTPFLKAYIPIYLYPLLNTVSSARSFESLRLTCLGVIGALVKADDTEAIGFLLQSEIIPLCLRIMETGEELSKTVATYIVERIVLDEAGLQYICFNMGRFFALASVLQTMVISLAEQPSARLLKHIICCYHRLTDHPRALEALRIRLPEALKNGTFVHCLKDDPVARNYLRQLLSTLAAPRVEAPQPPGPTEGGAPHAGPGSSQAGPSRVRR